MRPATRQDLVKTIDEALKNWGRWGSINDMQLTWEVYINLYIDNLTQSQQALVSGAKQGGGMREDVAWRWVVDDLASHIWKHLREMKEI